MKLFYAKEMHAVDAKVMNETGLPELVLMENAGRAVTDAADVFLEGVCGKKIVVFVGRGNNGGDGLVAARLLTNMGAYVRVVTMTPVKQISGSAGRELKALRYCDIPIISFGQGQNNYDKVLNFAKGADLFIDAILGTGFHGQVEGVYAQALKVIAHCAVPVIAVDIPSGVEADTGKTVENAVRAQVTVTMLAPKVGLYFYPGAEFVGDVVVSDISVPEALLDNLNNNKHLITEDMVAELAPLRPANAHKGMAGRIRIWAGSQGLTGAAALTSCGALRSGGGLVKLLTPTNVQAVMASKLTEVMTLGADTLAELQAGLADADVLAVGPGLGREPATAALVRELLPQLQMPVVIDADALNALAEDITVLKQIKSPKILTPHLGEMARLTGLTIGEIMRNSIKVACDFAHEYNCVLLLKGTPTIIATPKSEIYVNTNGNAGMATGGCGDVLTGILAALIGQGLDVVEAAICGVYLHGAAGDLAASSGLIGMTAGDICHELPHAWKHIIMGDEA